MNRVWAIERKTYLYIGIAASLILHAAALALRFTHPQPPTRPPAESLDVTLVNAQTEAAPVAPQVIAQSNLNAGGNTANNNAVASTPLPRTSAEAPDEIILEAMRKRQAELEARQEQLLTQLEARLQVNTAPRPDLLQQSDEPGRDNRIQDSALLAAQIAALKERIERYNARPRQQFVGPAAQQAAYAQYVEAWRQKIEHIGTTHYPQEARGKIYGTLQLTTYIKKDGSLERVEINRPSSEPVLNLAARRIVQLAAPFPPLPPEVAQDLDILAITRTWHFTNDQLITQ